MISLWNHIANSHKHRICSFQFTSIYFYAITYFSKWQYDQRIIVKFYWWCLCMFQDNGHNNNAFRESTSEMDKSQSKDEESVSYLFKPYFCQYLYFCVSNDYRIFVFLFYNFIITFYCKLISRQIMCHVRFWDWGTLSSTKKWNFIPKIKL